MRRFIGLFLIMTFGVVATLAEVDVKSLSNEELQQLIDAATAEIKSRKTTESGEYFIYDQDGIQFSYVEEYKDNGIGSIRVPFTLINNGEVDVGVMMGKAYVNGWEIQKHCNISAKIGKREKTDFTFYLDKSDAKTLQDIETLEFDITLYDATHYKTLKDETIILHPAK